MEKQESAGIVHDNKVMSYTPHPPIIINGNADFIVGMNGVVSGSGTKGDPYIISGWEFNTSVYNTQIFINNTNRYVKIKDCYVHNENYSRTPIGIYLQDVLYARVENNTFCGSFYRAIYLVVRHNVLTDNFVSNNTVYNGLVGIWMHSLLGNGAVHDNHILNNHVYNNSQQGIVLGNVLKNFVHNNTVEHNGQVGLMLHTAQNSILSYNSLIDNNGGMELDATSDTNTIYLNEFMSNNGTSINQVVDNSYANNSWSHLNLGNYWSDYKTRYPYAVNVSGIWNKSYDIPGSNGAKDNYPLAYTITPPPSAPLQLYPDNNIRMVGNLVNLSWLPGNYSVLTTFEVFLAPDNPPGTIIASNLTTDFLWVPTIDSIKLYWRVAAVNPFGIANSTVRNFTENSKPPVPQTPVTPLNGGTDIIYGTLHVSWAASNDAENDTVIYEWRVGNTSSMAGIDIANGTATTNRSDDFTTDPNTTYYWIVRTYDGYEWSNWSNNVVPWNFTTRIDNPPLVSLISPDGGEVWRNSTIQKIKWNATDDIPLPSNPIDIYYSINNGTDWNTIDVACPNNGSYAWLVPEYINSTECLVKTVCTDSTSHVSNDTSNWTFTITNYTAPVVDNPPSVVVISPNGREIWNSSTIHKIKWNATDDNPLPSDPIDIWYSTDNGTSWAILDVIQPNNGTYAWVLPDDINSTQCLVKVECTDSASHTANDTSNGTFTITNYTVAPPDNPPAVHVINPNGGEVWDQDTIHTVKWNATDDKSLSSTCINISYSENNGTTWTIIGYELGNNGTMAWQVPNTVNSTQCLVKVECMDSTMQTTIDTSNATFTIREVIIPIDNPPEISILAPKADDTWYGGEAWTIRWNATDDKVLPLKCINISYSLDNGANWTVIATRLNNTENYSWPVPRNDTSDGRINVTVFDLKGQTAADISGKFTIEKWNKSADKKPVIESTPVTVAEVGKTYTYQVKANDTDVPWGDFLTFSLETNPAGMEINDTSGLIKWVPQEEGNYSVTVNVTDSQGLSANQTFSITVSGSTEKAQYDFLLYVAMFVIILIIVFLVAYFVFIRRKQQPISQSDTSEERKKKLYEYIAKHPDDDSESISKALGMQKRDLETDVGLLIDLGHVEERRDGRHRRYTVKKPLEEPVKRPVIIGETPPVKPQPELAKKEETIPVDLKKPDKTTEKPPVGQQPAPIPAIVEKREFVQCPTCDAKVTADKFKCPECGENLKKEEKKIELPTEEPEKASTVPVIPEINKEIPPKSSPVKSEDEIQQSYRDKIEAHLFRYGKYRTEYTKPFEITQEGISSAINVSVPKVGINLRRMEDDELVIKEKCRVKDKWRTLYVYFLTSKGEQEARLLMEEKEGKKYLKK